MKGSRRHSSLLTEPATFQCSFSFLENKINKKEFLAAAEPTGHRTGQGELYSKTRACILSVWAQVLLLLFFIFISYIIKILWPFLEVSALKKKNNEEGKE